MPSNDPNLSPNSNPNPNRSNAISEVPSQEDAPKRKFKKRSVTSAKLKRKKIKHVQHNSVNAEDFNYTTGTGESSSESDTESLDDNDSAIESLSRGTTGPGLHTLTRSSVGSSVSLASSKHQLMMDVERAEAEFGTSLGVFKWNNSFRMFSAKIAGSKWFRIIILLVIILNCVVLVLEAEFDKPGKANSQVEDVLYYFELLFLAIFVLEMCVKVVALGFLFNGLV